VSPVPGTVVVQRGSGGGNAVDDRAAVYEYIK
jgi:hypothetical protein